VGGKLEAGQRVEAGSFTHFELQRTDDCRVGVGSVEHPRLTIGDRGQGRAVDTNLRDADRAQTVQHPRRVIGAVKGVQQAFKSGLIQR
jgi:hypothetical protein